MEDETRNDQPDTEAHKLSKASGDESEAEKDEPDVEGHKLANKLSHKLDT